MERNSCRDCAYLEFLEADSSDGWPDENAGFSCWQRNVRGLKQFPFKSTNCKSFNANNAMREREPKS